MSNEDQKTEDTTPVQEGYQPKEVHLGYGANIKRGYQPDAQAGSIDSIVLPAGGTVVTTTPAAAQTASPSASAKEASSGGTDSSGGSTATDSHASEGA